jgi:hypothetical protein
VISYMQSDKVEETTSTITINIVKPASLDPLLVVSSYDVGTDMLKPGDQFRLKLQLQNIGKADASNLIVMFGTVSGSADASVTPAAQNADTSVSVIPGDVFAPLKTGGTVLIGAVPVNGMTTITQDFIVNAKVTSGVYGLPVTLRYKLLDGSTVQSNLRVSLVVVLPPQLQVTLQNPLPSVGNVGESQSVSLKITNSGKDAVNLTTFDMQAENAQITDGAESTLSVLDANANVSVNGTLIPSAEGLVRIKVSLHYLDDLHREQVIVKTYEMQAVTPPPPATFVPQVAPPVVEDDTPQNVMQRLLFGLLGLGS